MIDKSSGIPLYQQIEEYLINYIKINKDNSKKIPSENELSMQFGISRPTVRKALDHLVKDNIIEKIHGKGTFIKVHKKIIQFTNWQNTEEITKKPLEHIINKFLETRQDVIINNNGIIYKDLIQNLIEMTGHGNAPDIMAITYLWIPLLVNQGSLYPLNKYYTNNLKEKLYAQSTKAVTYKNNYYGFNWGNGPHILYYNKNILFDCFGIKDLEFEYYDQLCEFFTVINEKYKGSIIPFCLPFNNNDLRFVLIHFLYIFLFSFDGGIVDDQGEIIFNSENNIKAFQWLKSFIKKGKINLNLDLDEARKKFAENKMAFWIDGPWYKNIIPTLNKKNNIDIGYKILPKTPPGLSYSSLSNHVLSISNQCNNKDDAVEIIKYITMDKSISEYYYNKTGMLPASMEEINNNSVYDDEFGRVLKKQMETSLPIPDAYPGFSYSMNFCTKACKEILIGDNDITTILNNTAESIKEIYK
jgi:ABC-type glycerol-3-phosphate transport system substrate-binding protein